MADPSSCTSSGVHTRAICEEVGERLRISIDRSQTPPPPRILALLLKLQLSELNAPALTVKCQKASTAA
jgi:hypothetical protein